MTTRRYARIIFCNVCRLTEGFVTGLRATLRTDMVGAVYLIPAGSPTAPQLLTELGLRQHCFPLRVRDEFEFLLEDIDTL